MTREEAIELLESMKGDLYDLYDDNDLTALDLAISALSENKGEWIDSSNGWTCSICNRDSTYDTNFCPNCGADMRGE